MQAGEEPGGRVLVVAENLPSGPGGPGRAAGRGRGRPRHPAQPQRERGTTRGLSDPLTGLGNRRLGERERERELLVARSARHGAVVMAAVDGHAELGEAHGNAVLHDAGGRHARTLHSGATPRTRSS